MNAPTRAASSSVRGVMVGSMPCSSSRVDESAHAGELGEMMIGVAEHGVDGRDALEIVPDLVLHCHTDAAVELDCLLTDEAPGPTDLHLGSGDSLASIDLITLVRHHGRQHAHAARLLERDQHVSGAVLQHLEAADRHAELLAGLEVVDG